jgi:hypothetical protein
MSDQWSSDDSEGIRESKRSVADKVDSLEDIVKRIAHVQRSLGRSQADLSSRAQKLGERHDESPSHLCLRRLSLADFYAMIADYNRLRGQLESLDTALDRAIGVREMFGKPRRGKNRTLRISKWRTTNLPLRPDTPITEDESKPSKPGNMNWV